MIIALCGYAKSGKDTVADIVKTNYPSFKNMKFSGKLKVIAGILTGIEPALFESQYVKNYHFEGWGMTGRELLQRLGTDAIRDGLHKDAWVNALMSDYHQYEDWIITDCRFKNEAKAVKEFGGYVVRVVRDGVGPVNGHPSETELDDWHPDFELRNDGTLEQLKDNTISLMDKIKNL